MYAVRDSWIDLFSLNHSFGDKSITQIGLSVTAAALVLFEGVCVLKLGENTLYGQKDVDTFF